jgi:hypothetical protein
MNACVTAMRALLATAAFMVASIIVRARAESLYDVPSYCDVQRAGDPRSIAPWAKPQDPCKYDGYYAGGGAWRYKHDGRGCHQGTWGWDYTGKWVHPLVRLGWTHPPRYQGGTGSYQPDGPRPYEELKSHCEEHAKGG